MLPSTLHKPTRLLLTSNLCPFSYQSLTIAPKRSSGPGRAINPPSIQAGRGVHQYAVAVNPATDFFTSFIPGAAQRTKPVGFDEEPCTLTLTDGYGYAQVEIGDRWGPREEYEIVRKLGWGMFATTWLAYNHQKKQYYALKIINEYGTYLESHPSSSLSHPRFHELPILTRVSNPTKPSGRGPKHVLRLSESFYTTRGTARYLCLALELAGMDLDTLRSNPLVSSDRALHPLLVKSLVKQLCVGLNYLHAECKVVHTDLKPGNILLGLSPRESKRLVKALLEDTPLVDRYPPRRVMGETIYAIKSKSLPLTASQSTNDDGSPKGIELEDMLCWKFKIADFGSAQWLGRRSTNLVQPIRLRAPEVLWGRGWDERVDVWALGCLTFEFLAGRTLFPLQNIPHRTTEDLDEVDAQKFAIYDLLGPSSPTFFNQSSSKKSTGIESPTPSHILTSLSAELRLSPSAPINSSPFGKEERDRALAFITQCLVVNPGERPSAKELLRDPWIRGVKAPLRRIRPPPSDAVQKEDTSVQEEDNGAEGKRKSGQGRSPNPKKRLGISDKVDKSSVYGSTFPSIH